MSHATKMLQVDIGATATDTVARSTLGCYDANDRLQPV